MNLNTLPKITRRKAKIVGRGIGSGKGGHTTGRGNKGQKARERVTIWFEGTKNKKALVKRLPLLRGKNKFKPWGETLVAVASDRLMEWPVKQAVTHEALIKAGIISGGEKAKLVRGKKWPTGLTVEVPMSKQLVELMSKTEAAQPEKAEPTRAKKRATK